MACDKPNPDSTCTNVSPCSTGCGCSGGTTPSPVLPKCQDVNLITGTFTHATIVVNAAGCISQITSGEPELYTPDECCGGSSGGAGSPGPRGLKGDPGAAATVDVVPTVATGAAWAVENIGSTSAAVLKFTAPSATSGSSSTVGVSDTLNGFLFENGLVKQIPTSLVTVVEAQAQGDHASLIQIYAIPSTTIPGRYDITLNLDLLHLALTNAFTELHNEQADLIADLTTALANLSNSHTALQGTVSTLQSSLSNTQTSLSALQASVAALETALDECCNTSGGNGGGG